MNINNCSGISKLWQKQKVIFDCDLGDDIDDAFALALVIASPEFEVLGITMAYGNTPERAKIACRMLYDCVAVGMVLWPDLFRTRPAHVKVIDGGYTVMDESKQSNCKVGIWIHKEEFLKRLLHRYLAQNLLEK